jgi:hypothetical protein
MKNRTCRAAFPPADEPLGAKRKNFPENPFEHSALTREKRCCRPPFSNGSAEDGISVKRTAGLRLIPVSFQCTLFIQIDDFKAQKVI